MQQQRAFLTSTKFCSDDYIKKFDIPVLLIQIVDTDIKDVDPQNYEDQIKSLFLETFGTIEINSSERTISILNHTRKLKFPEKTEHNNNFFERWDKTNRLILEQQVCSSQTIILSVRGILDNSEWKGLIVSKSQKFDLFYADFSAS